MKKAGTEVLTVAGREVPITNAAKILFPAAKITKLGGKVLMGKTAVPHMGYFAICHDTEKNMFAVWEVDKKAK